MEKRVELKDSARFLFAPPKSKRLRRRRQAVEPRLQIPPKFRFDGEIRAESARGFFGNRAASVNYFANLRRRNAQVKRESAFRNSRRFQEFFRQNLAGTNDVFSFHQTRPSLLLSR
jgi:hypothetical protein